MAYRAYQPDRRTKRRRWLLIILTLIAVVALIVLLVSRRTEQRGTVEFYAAADVSSDLNSDAADTFNSTLAQIGPLLSRQEVTSRLAEVTATAQEAEETLNVDVPSSVGAAYGTMTTAAASWADGAAEFERVVLGIMDGEIVTAAELQIQAALDQLRVGDVAFEQFRVEAALAAEEHTVPDFGPVAYIDPTADPLMYDAQNLVLKIQAAYNLAPHRNVGVVGTTLPEPVGERGGIPLVPFSESIGIHAVVSNLGNEDETDVAVSLEMLNVDTGQAFSDLQNVDLLEAGASTTAMFDALPLTPGGLYQASVSVTIEEDNDPSNNVWSFTFIWNEES